MAGMGTPEPEAVVTALHRFGLERDRLRTALSRRLGVAVADLDALEHLELAGALSQRELTERLLLTSGAVTQLVDRLERMRLVTRRPHPTDRRITLVELAPDAELPDVPELSRYHEAARGAAGELSAAGRAQVARFLADVTNSAAAATEQLPPIPHARQDTRRVPRVASRPSGSVQPTV
jgi:DNA-binding MarR family transcriptional regulator